MEKIVIGKAGNQPFSIQDPNVSRYHAALVVDDNGRMTLTDTSSTNGTYIYNGNEFVRLFANHPYPVNPDMMIQLGPDTRFHIRRLLARKTQPEPVQRKSPQPQPKPERIDISNLRRISDEYTKKKMELESKMGTINGLRSCTIIISMLAGGLGAYASQNLDLGGKGSMLSSILSIAIAVMLMAVLLIFINRFNRKIIVQRNENEHNYAVKYCCPKCGLSYRGKIYENILSERRCPRCKSEYYEKPRKN